MALAAAVLLADHARAMTPEERRAYRDRLVEVLPAVPAFSDWLKKTDELPPDFDALPKVNGLPDPLRFLDGKAVSTKEEWGRRRAEILDLFQRYAWGKFPQHAALSGADVTDTPEKGYKTRQVVLHFGPAGQEKQGVMHCTMIIPDGPGPFPVLMGPGLIGGFGGNTADMALRRGYIALSYAGNDSNDDSKALAALYPNADFATLPRRAWAASEILDYLQTVPEVDMKRVAIFGYSRDGKQAMIAGALDERISAVIAGSTGVGGVLPYRLAGERNQAESIESTTRMFPDWFVPRLRFFSGREDRLPVDGNLLLSAVAPRPVLMISGYNDEVSNTWGDEQSLHSAQKVYALLGAGDKVGLYRVPGFHGANDMEVALDFLDIQFGRQNREWVSQFVFPWDWEKWRAASGEHLAAKQLPADNLAEWNALPTKEAWEAYAKGVRDSVVQMLGEAPPYLPTRQPGPGGARCPGVGDPAEHGRHARVWMVHRGGAKDGVTAGDLWRWGARNALLSSRPGARKEIASGDLAAQLQLSPGIHVGLSSGPSPGIGPGQGWLRGFGVRPVRLRQPDGGSLALLRPVSTLVADGAHG
jgi:hypothetical protein